MFGQSQTTCFWNGSCSLMFALAWASQHVFTCIQAIDIARPSSCKEDNCFPSAPSLCTFPLPGGWHFEVGTGAVSWGCQEPTHWSIATTVSICIMFFFMLQNGHTPGVNPSISDTRSGRYVFQCFLQISACDQNPRIFGWLIQWRVYSCTCDLGTTWNLFKCLWWDLVQLVHLLLFAPIRGFVLAVSHFPGCGLCSVRFWSRRGNTASAAARLVDVVAWQQLETWNILKLWER